METNAPSASNAPADDLAVVNAFYATLLSAAPQLTEEGLYAVLSRDFVSEPTPPAGSGAQGMFKTLKFFAQVVPDLSWQPQEILTNGNRYTVRSKASGTPVGPFLGIEPATGKRFEIMSIDILTVEDGKVVHSYHVEDWATAIRQLTE
ncbi:MAG: polyketide cyclase [Betaproteobacteria bacterium]|nr:polyketide cyclase [Betaproteobacteria bacterium]